LEQVVQVPLLAAAASRKRPAARPRDGRPVQHVPPTWGTECRILACRWRVALHAQHRRAGRADGRSARSRAAAVRAGILARPADETLADDEDLAAAVARRLRLADV